MSKAYLVAADVVDWLKRLAVHVLIGDRLKVDVLYLLALDIFDIREIADYYGLSVAVVRAIRGRYGRVVSGWDRLILHFYSPLLECCEGRSVVEEVGEDTYRCVLCGAVVRRRSGLVLHLRSRHDDFLDSLVSCVFDHIRNRKKAEENEASN